MAFSPLNQIPKCPIRGLESHTGSTVQCELNLLCVLQTMCGRAHSQWNFTVGFPAVWHGSTEKMRGRDIFYNCFIFAAGHVSATAHEVGLRRPNIPSSHTGERWPNTTESENIAQAMSHSFVTFPAMVWEETSAYSFPVMFSCGANFKWSHTHIWHTQTHTSLWGMSCVLDPN